MYFASDAGLLRMPWVARTLAGWPEELRQAVATVQGGLLGAVICKWKGGGGVGPVEG